MTLKERIAEEMKAAMREKDTVRLESIRLLRAAIQRKEVDERIDLDDPAVLAMVQKLVKQGRDSIAQFEVGGRDDLVAKEAANIAVFESYLPEQLSDDELTQLVKEALAESGASSIRDMGKVMGLLRPRLQGRADMSSVSALVKQHLS